MMETGVPTLSSTNLPNVLSGDGSSSVLASEPSVNGLVHDDQTGENVESNLTKPCDAIENVVTLKEDSITTAKQQITETSDYDSKQNDIEEVPFPTENRVDSAEDENCDTLKGKEVEGQDENNEYEELKKYNDEDEAEEMFSSTQKNERPKRDVQRRSVFEMLQSEIDDEDEEHADAMEKVEEKVIESRDGGRRKRKTRDDESELNLDDLNDGDDDDGDEDFTADTHQKKCPIKKKPAAAKKEEKTLVLFDDDDLPLKGKRSGGRPKKKKLEEDEAPSEEEWALTGRIRGKLFHDDEDDHENDIDFIDFSFRQQSSPDKKVLLSSNKRILDSSSKQQSCSKKIKIDVQGRKFSKPRDGMETKPKSRASAGLSTQHHSSGHHGSGASNTNAGAQRHGADDGRTGSLAHQDEDMRRKQSILTIWEQKLRHLDRELEDRVAIIRKNEGKILREERRLKEYECVLIYREKLLSNCEEFVAATSSGGGGDDITEKLSCLKGDYEKYRRLAEEHKNWIEKEHQRIEVRTSDEETTGSTRVKKGETNDLPSMDDLNKNECTPEKPNQDKAAPDHLIVVAATPPEETKVDG